MTKVHFLHIGKTGGTAIAEALAEFPPSFPVIVHPHTVRLPHISEGQPVFFVLRDPVDRFVSGFYSRQRRGRPRYNGSWTPEEELAFARYSTANQLAEELDNASDETRAFAGAAMTAIDHVRTSFFDWFSSEDYFLSRLADVLFVGMIEHLDEDFARLRPMIGLGPDAKLPGDDLRRHSNPPGVDRELSSRAVSNLTAWYLKDYGFFGLCNRIREERGFRASKRGATASTLL